MTTPGWFPDPSDPSRLRYFDGRIWTDQYTTLGPTPPPMQQPAKPGMSKGMKIGLTAGAAFLGLAALGSIGTNDTSSPTPSRSGDVALDAPPPKKSGFTPSQDNAIEKAQSYLSTGDFSRKGLIEQLEYNKFSTADATFAVERIEATGGVDWNAEAIDKAKSYLRTGSFSLESLVEQLEYNGFTPAQAQLGANTAYQN